jgi:hypothetical protein
MDGKDKGGRFISFPFLAIDQAGLASPARAAGLAPTVRARVPSREKGRKVREEREKASYCSSSSSALSPSFSSKKKHGSAPKWKREGGEE